MSSKPVVNDLDTIVKLAKKQWRGCVVRAFGSWPENVGDIQIELPAVGPDSIRRARPLYGGSASASKIKGWYSEWGPDDSDHGRWREEGPDPVSAILAAVRAEREEAELTLARCALWDRK